jgi:hypothetical protein
VTYADDIKVRLLSWLLPQLQEDEIVASEVPFDNGTFKADLLIASSTRLEAIEIKGPRDDLRKLEKQIVGYGSLFLAVSVVIDDRHMPAARRVLPRSVGILEASERGVLRSRQPVVKTVLKKEASVMWLQGPQLRRALADAGYSMDRRSTVDELRAECARLLTANTLTSIALASVLSRCRKRYEAFVHEMGTTVTLDDLKMLSLGSMII